MLSWWMAMTPRRHPVQPKCFEYEYTPIVLYGSSAISDRKPGTKVPYTSSVIIIRLGLRVFTILTSRCIELARIARDGGLLGLTRKNALIRLSASLSISASVYCQEWVPSGFTSLPASTFTTLNL